MSTPTEILLQKAMTVVETLASAGRLNPEQSEKFLQYVIDETSWRGFTTTRSVSSDWEIDKISIGERIMTLAAEAEDPRIRRKASTEKIVLTPREVIAGVELSYSLLEENIEGDNVEDTILKMIATRFANNLELWFWQANTVTPAEFESNLFKDGSTTEAMLDTLMGAFNGWLKLAAGGNVLDAAGANIHNDLFIRAMLKMPTKFLTNPSALRWLMPTYLDTLWTGQFANRVGSAADGIVAGAQAPKPFGVEKIAAPLMPWMPQNVEHKTLVNDATPVQLAYAPIQPDSVIVVLTTLAAKKLVTPFVENTDYTVDYAAGTLVKVGGGIPDGTAVKITYRTNPRMILTLKDNFVAALGRDIMIETDRNIWHRTKSFVVTTKAAVQIQELSGLVVVNNIGMGL